MQKNTLTEDIKKKAHVWMNHPYDDKNTKNRSGFTRKSSKKTCGCIFIQIYLLGQQVLEVSWGWEPTASTPTLSESQHKVLQIISTK